MLQTAKQIFHVSWINIVYVIPKAGDGQRALSRIQNERCTQKTVSRRSENSKWKWWRTTSSTIGLAESQSPWKKQQFSGRTYFKYITWLLSYQKIKQNIICNSFVAFLMSLVSFLTSSKLAGFDKFWECMAEQETCFRNEKCHSRDYIIIAMLNLCQKDL